MTYPSSNLLTKLTLLHRYELRMTAEDFSESNGKYDCAFSISSVEHSGLGRYGDDLDPEGDLKAMDDLRSRLNSGGLCFLAVPMGEDCVFWNAHRQYGRVRFPMLIKGFEVIGEYGWQDSDFDILARKGLTKQPVIVLRKIYCEKYIQKSTRTFYYTLCIEVKIYNP